MKLHVINGLSLMVSLSNHGQHRFFSRTRAPALLQAQGESYSVMLMTLTAIWRMARIFSLLLLGALLGGGARAQDGSVEAGLEYARAICAECHAIRGGGDLSPNPKAPPFGKIANTPGITGAALNVILSTPHRNMPDFIIPAKDKADVVAYILSLQK